MCSTIRGSKFAPPPQPRLPRGTGTSAGTRYGDVAEVLTDVLTMGVAKR